MTYTTAEIAKHLQGEVVGDASVQITGFAPADRACPGDLTFAENDSFLQRAEGGDATAVIVESAKRPSSKILICVADARVACAKALPLFFPDPTFEPGIHPSAVVAESATIDPTAHIGPGCVVGENVQIGPRCVLEGLDWVGAECRLDEDARLFPNVTLYGKTEIGKRVRLHAGVVVGSDGFGYVQDGATPLKVPQIGMVIIRDDVELGANATVDRGALGPTVIGEGTKIDNLVQVAHNVTIGSRCLIVAQTGISGSTKLGDSVTLGGQVGVAGHIRLGNQVSVGAQSGVMHNLRDGERVLGYPAIPDRQLKRQVIAVQRLPELRRQVQAMERRLNELEQAQE